jgi:cellobiose transport system substrate-binding protein
MGVTSRRRTAAIALIAVAALGASAACNKKDDNGGSSNQPIELIVDVFGEFGYKDLYTKYMTDHPNIKITERGTGQGLGDENTKLNQWISSGAGAGDIVAVEEGTLTDFKDQADAFENLLDYGAGSLQSNFLDWKWKQGMTSDGKLLGLGTDVGSMGMCYRTDKFAAAGLPTKREDVANLWKTWDDFINLGNQFKAKDKKTAWVDSATNVYNTILMQTAGNGSGYTYYDNSNNLVLDKNPDIKTAWDTTVKVINAGLSGKFPSFSDQWTAAFKNAGFATIACPAWMLGVIKNNAGDSAAGKWDVTTAPGGAGNWGGSFLAVPSQGKHKKEAAELAKFLTSPDSQFEVFKKVNNLPSSPVVYDKPDFQAFKNDYFSGAPVGQIFGAGAKALKPVYLGPKNQAVRTAVEDALRSIEDGKKKPDAAWQDALTNGAAAAK